VPSCQCGSARLMIGGWGTRVNRESGWAPAVDGPVIDRASSGRPGGLDLSELVGRTCRQDRPASSSRPSAPTTTSCRSGPGWRRWTRPTSASRWACSSTWRPSGASYGSASRPRPHPAPPRWPSPVSPPSSLIAAAAQHASGQGLGVAERTPPLWRGGGM